MAVTLVKFHLCMKCLDTSAAALPYTTAPISCHGMRGVVIRSTESRKQIPVSVRLF